MEPVTPISQQAPQPLAEEKLHVVEVHHKKNIYPLVRHVFLIAAILCALCFIVFLMYQNGKIIYDNGL